MQPHPAWQSTNMLASHWWWYLFISVVLLPNFQISLLTTASLSSRKNANLIIVILITNMLFFTSAKFIFVAALLPGWWLSGWDNLIRGYSRFSCLQDDADSGYSGSGDTTKTGFTLSSVEIKERIRKYNDSNRHSKMTEVWQPPCYDSSWNFFTEGCQKWLLCESERL